MYKYKFMEPQNEKYENNLKTKIHKVSIIGIML